MLMFTWQPRGGRASRWASGRKAGWFRVEPQRPSVDTWGNYSHRRDAFEATQADGGSVLCLLIRIYLLNTTKDISRTAVLKIPLGIYQSSVYSVLLLNVKYTA